MKNEGIISALYILLLLLFFPNIIEVATYSISLKVNTTGIVEIINDTYLQGLSDIKVDGTSVLSTPKKNTVNIDDIDKEIRLEWNTIPSNCNFMFSSLTNIESSFIFFNNSLNLILFTFILNSISIFLSFVLVTKLIILTFNTLLISIKVFISGNVLPLS